MYKFSARLSSEPQIGYIAPGPTDISLSSHKMLNIVISVNSSEPSQYAFDWVMKNFLRPEDHKVTLLTVVEPPIQAGYYYAASAGAPFVSCAPIN